MPNNYKIKFLQLEFFKYRIKLTILIAIRIQQQPHKGYLKEEKRLYLRALYH